LIEALLAKLQPFISGDDKNFKSQEVDINEKLESPGGPGLLSSVAYIYIQEAKKNLGRFAGLQGWFAGIEEKGHGLKQGLSLVSSLVKLQVAQERLEAGEQTEQLVNDIMSQGLSMIWKVGLLEIESIVRDICQTVLNIPDKVLKKKRAEALEELGKVYKREIRLARKRGVNFDPFFDPEASAKSPKK